MHRAYATWLNISARFWISQLTRKDPTYRVCNAARGIYGGMSNRAGGVARAKREGNHPPGTLILLIHPKALSGKACQPHSRVTMSHLVRTVRQRATHLPVVLFNCRYFYGEVCIISCMNTWRFICCQALDHILDELPCPLSRVSNTARPLAIGDAQVTNVMVGVDSKSAIACQCVPLPEYTAYIGNYRLLVYMKRGIWFRFSATRPRHRAH